MQIQISSTTTLRSPRLRLPGKSSTCVLDLALTCFATLSDLLFIQDRRFTQSHGWWYFLASTTALLATSCRTGFSTRRIRSYLIKWALWWVMTSATWSIEEMLHEYIKSCWDYNFRRFAVEVSTLPNICAVGGELARIFA